jgi:F-type H+-transporting ATPase subunit b
MISINETLLVQVIQFLLFVFILNRLMLRPLRQKVDERWKHIDNAKKESEQLSEKVKELAQKRIDIEAEARKSASGERMQLKQEALSQAEAVFEETRNEVARIRMEIEKEVQAQVAKAQEALNQEVTVLADEIVDKIAGRRVSN